MNAQVWPHKGWNQVLCLSILWLPRNGQKNFEFLIVRFDELKVRVETDNLQDISYRMELRKNEMEDQEWPRKVQNERAYLLSGC